MGWGEAFNTITLLFFLEHRGLPEFTRLSYVFTDIGYVIGDVCFKFNVRQAFGEDTNFE